ncbi:MAG: Phospho-2-dehydro-3-deoxyheptonate aldolase [Bacteroidota bacterium]|jgi:chorismate mutase
MSIKLDLIPVSEWGFQSSQRPIVIAGPCSAETEEQVMETARQVAAQGVTIFRAGIWKPRTRPNSFEGVGAEGLVWLQKVRQETGMKVGTEVANAKHVYEAIKYGVDLLWIGARTTVNPFAVQEIADALQGVDIPILVKNPVSPDLSLWMGALERLNKVGIKKLGAIHRGFTVYDTTPYRNPPQWQLAIDLMQKLPDLPIFADPSHMAGNREFLFSLSQKALDLHYTGLMIETHITPEKAWSDASQQVTPEGLRSILDRLVVRHRRPEDPKVMESLEDLRAQIDKLDDILMDNICRRMDIADQIGMYKRENNMTILQSGRWEEITQHRREDGLKRGLSEAFLDRYLKAVHQESINRQSKIMNEDLTSS